MNLMQLVRRRRRRNMCSRTANGSLPYAYRPKLGMKRRRFRPTLNDTSNPICTAICQRVCDDNYGAIMHEQLPMRGRTRRPSCCSTTTLPAARAIGLIQSFLHQQNWKIRRILCIEVFSHGNFHIVCLNYKIAHSLKRSENNDAN